MHSRVVTTLLARIIRTLQDRRKGRNTTVLLPALTSRLSLSLLLTLSLAEAELKLSHKSTRTASAGHKSHPHFALTLSHASS